MCLSLKNFSDLPKVRNNASQFQCKMKQIATREEFFGSLIWIAEKGFNFAA
jgi:hypothetical protein